MRTVGKTLLAALLLAGTAVVAAAQRFTVGTDGMGWLALGTVNADASVAVSRNVSLHAGAALNPWTYRKDNPDKQLQLRQLTVWGGARWWPWHVYSGWWAGMDARYMVYNAGGIIKRETEEGDAYGARIWGGYSVMLSEHWNLDMGVGAWGGWKKYTVYSCPSCGVTLEQGGKVFVLPDARVAIQLIF